MHDRTRAWVVIGAVAALTIAIRFHLRHLPLERDEGEYAYTALEFLWGSAPYARAYTMKLPGVAAAYALFFAALGPTALVVRFAGGVVAALGTLFAFLLGRRLFGDLPAALGAAVFAVLGLSVEMLGPYAHATQFVIACALAGLWLLSRSLDLRSRAALAGAGALLCLAAIMKQPGALFTVVALAWVARVRRRDVLGDWRWLLAGAALPVAAVLLSVRHDFARAWLWAVQYAAAYESQLTTTAAMHRLARYGLPLTGAAAPAIALAVAGLAFGTHRRLLSVLLVMSAAGVAVGGYFRPHYFVLALPWCALAIAAAAQRFPRVVPALVTVACAQVLWVDRRVFFAPTVPRVSHEIHGPSPFPEAIVIARYIEAHSRLSDTVAILGSEPEIPFYAQRRSATGFLYMYPLTEAQPFALEMQERLERELEDARPQWAVQVDIPGSWLWSAKSHRELVRWLGDWRAAHYEVRGIVDELAPDRTEYYWDADVARAPAAADRRLWVLRRKD